MERSRPTLIVFQAGQFHSGGPLEDLVLDAQKRATLDLLSRAAESDAFEQIILVTEDPALANSALFVAKQWPADLSIHLERSPASHFHFGRSLRAICRSHKVERVVYLGGGAMPLGGTQELRDLALAVSGAGECVVANNLFSADMVAFWPSSALERITLPPNDNDLAWQLHFRAGLPYAPMPRTLASQFDIDTPSDLATLWWSCQMPPLYSAIGKHLAEVLARVPVEMPRLAEKTELAYKVMTTRRAQLTLAGRLSSWVWRRLELNLPCQTRVLSEERGMRASGREDRGDVRSLLGLYVDVAGVDGLISALEQTCDAAFLDTRVLFAHRGLKPSAKDRFASDAFMPQLISEPWVRELTEAAASSRIPILLGGHALLAGGVWALSERVRGSASASGS